MLNSDASTGLIVKDALKKGIVIPGFNIPYLPMMEPVVKALRDTNTFGLIMVARLEWIKFKSGSMNVMGHESGPLPPYEVLFASGKGFTSPDEAKRFVEETQTDWLSVAIGNIHGAISAATRTEKKIEARLAIPHLEKINNAVHIPLVLHGGTGIDKEYLMCSFKKGIAKINIATAIRQPYERMMNDSIKAGQEAVYNEMLDIINNQLEIAGSASCIF